MTEEELGYDSLAVAQDIANYTVGFCKLTVRGNEEDAIPAGSGTLVTIGNVSGILTAAHVVEHIRHEGQVGIVRFPNRQGLVQKLKLEMKLTDAISPRQQDFGPTGPISHSCGSRPAAAPR
jgi:hypothetical protein